jgi:hypothetical protein
VIASTFSDLVGLAGALGGPLVAGVALFGVMRNARRDRIVAATEAADAKAAAETAAAEATAAREEAARSREVTEAVKDALAEMLPHVLQTLSLTKQVDVAVNVKVPGEESIGESVTKLRQGQKDDKAAARAADRPSIRELLEAALHGLPNGADDKATDGGVKKDG